MLNLASIDIQMLLELGSVFYVLIILIRGLRYLSIKAGFIGGRRQVTIIAIILGMMMFVGGEKFGWSTAITSLLMMSSIIALYTIISGGIATGSLVRRGVVGFFLAAALTISTLALLFFESHLVAPISMVVLGMNIVIEYRDMYGLMRSSLWGNEMMSYIFVYPPLILLLTLTDIIIISSMIGDSATYFL
jgi:hypothetical protein